MNTFESAISGKKIEKKFKGFELNIEELNIPKGYFTALIGENGAGKTTLINCMTGIRRDYKGSFEYFGKYNDEDRENDTYVKEHIGFTTPNLYFLPQWTIRQVKNLGGMLFDTFDANEFDKLLLELGVFENKIDYNKKISSFSTGNKMKVELAFVLARDTECLILDEPASPLDPLMKENLCDIMREYIASKDGERTIFCSTHDINDMEQVTDYAIFMEKGKIVEQGFVEDLKERYLVVKGDADITDAAEKALFTISKNRYGFEGMIRANRLDELAGLDIVVETPSLNQIAIAIMKEAKSKR